jgi:PPK2 family polyphosphate:nucleotide phosphotransferase
MAKPQPERIAQFIEPFRVEPGQKVKLPGDFDPAFTLGLKRDDADDVLQNGIELLAELQERLYAQNTAGLLVIIQAMDAAGKDGTIGHVMSGVNPQGVQVSSFKVPSTEEIDHDFLWRYAKRLPERGNIGIFNRSYYEELLVVRVHPAILDGQKIPPKLKGKGVWSRRFRHINNWEAYLVDQGFSVVKIFLNVSKEEQRLRFLSRIDEPEKNWKFAAGDVHERGFWDDYQNAFSDVLSHTSTKAAPWYVIPADNKWFARVAAGAVIADALIRIDPQYPEVSADDRAALEAARVELVADGGEPSPAPKDPTSMAKDPKPAPKDPTQRPKTKAKAKGTLTSKAKSTSKKSGARGGR